MSDHYVRSMDDLPKEIQQYIESSRFSVFIDEDQKKLANFVYKLAADKCREIAQKFEINCSFIKVYSDSCKSEAITDFSEGFSLIVHDQFLGQVFNMFNRILFYDCDSNTSMTYAHKFSSFNLCRFGYLREAIFCAEYYRDNRHSMDLYKKQTESGMITHAIVTRIQENFIILHELCHIIKRRKPGKILDKENYVRSSLRDYLNHNKTFFLSCMGENKSVKDSYRKSSVRFKFIDAYNQKSDDLADLAFSMIEEVGYLEELVCDLFSVDELSNHPDLLGFHVHKIENDLTFSSSDDDSSEISSKITFFIGIVTALLHLRTMQTVQSTINSHADMLINFNIEHDFNSIKFDPVVYFLNNIRVHFVKEYIFNNFFHESERSMAFESMFSLMDDHTDKIFSPSTTIVNNMLYNDKIISEYIEGLDEDLPDDDVEARLVVSALWQLGGSQSSDDLKKINAIQREFMDAFSRLDQDKESD